MIEKQNDTYASPPRPQNYLRSLLGIHGPTKFRTGNEEEYAIKTKSSRENFTERSDDVFEGYWNERDTKYGNKSIKENKTQ